MMNNAVIADALIPHERAIRKPLPGWASGLRDSFETWRLELTSGPSLTSVGGTMACFNENALIQALYGNGANAAALCHAALHWLAEAANEMPPQQRSAYCGYAFQPYLNLARLDRGNGLRRDAQDKLRVLRDAARECAVSFGPFEFTPLDLREIFRARPDVTDVLSNSFIIESLKTLLRARDYGSVIEFAEREMSTASPANADFLHEARIVALFHIGRFGDALASARERIPRSEWPNRMAFILRLAELLAASGDPAKALLPARAIMTACTERLPRCGLSMLLILVRAVAVCAACGDLEQAGQAAALGLQRSREIEDVLLEIEFLKLTADAGANDDEAAAVKSNAFYGAAKSPGPRCHSVERLHEQMLTFAHQRPQRVFHEAAFSLPLVIEQGIEL